ncbi:MAG: recombinational DNA repair protein (RecF pathway) [Lentimonas sp.]|jgi:recombinational DNA repair protein (RecF pathway)
MSKPAVTERALVLRIAPSGESFQKIDILTPESGTFLCLKRTSKGKHQTPSPDLFDTADIHLETSKQGTARFVNDYQLVHRRSSIGQSYRKLQHASDFCALIAQNGPHMADPAALYQITERTLDAFAERASPSIVFLKAVYILLKEEGYPVRESWWPQLPNHLREAGKQLINQPTPDSAEPELLEACTQISRNLCHWLRRDTDLMLPSNFNI